MSQYTRELAFGIAGEDQAGVDADEAARQSERIDPVVFHEEEIEVELAVVRVTCEL